MTPQMDETERNRRTRTFLAALAGGEKKSRVFFDRKTELEPFVDLWATVFVKLFWILTRSRG